MHKQKRTFSAVFWIEHGDVHYLVRNSPKESQSLGWLQSGLLTQLLPPKETGNKWSRGNYTPNLTTKDLFYSKTFCTFQIYRRTPEQWGETKAAGFPVGCAQPRLLAQNRQQGGTPGHNYRRDKGATKWIQMQRRDWRFDLEQYNSLQQQVETISNFLAFKTFQTGHEDTNSDVLERWVPHTGCKRLVPFLH